MAGGIKLSIQISQRCCHVASGVQIIGPSTVLLKVLNQLWNNTKALKSGILIKENNIRSTSELGYSVQ